MPQKIEFKNIKKLFESYGLRILNNGVKNSKQKITALNNDGYLVYISYEFLRTNNGGYRLWHKSNPYSMYNINKYTMDNFGVYTIDEEYVSLKHKMTWVCSECGSLYKYPLSNILQEHKSTCNKCSKIQATNKKRNSIEKIQNIFKKQGLKMLEEYQSNCIPIKCKDIEGYIVMGIYNSIKLGTKHLRFHVCNPYSIDNIKHYIKLNGLDCEIISNEYKGATNKMLFRCNCGRVFETSWGIFYGQGKTRCDVCSKNKPKTEMLVERYLINNNVNYKTQYRFSDCRHKYPLPFDFAIVNDDNSVHTLIEVDGIQHFEPVKAFGGEDRYKTTVLIDDIKNKYCKDNHYELIRISYKEIANGNYINKLKTLI
uniref:Restriction enzyme n=1 Tax=Siphoviridae sp. cteLh2 TaxID=2825590 RepID=A0A8S5U5M3_9CAUD|nr:MAG TPA: restriction enzyme [Siphoviridae sp. cteLh2]